MDRHTDRRTVAGTRSQLRTPRRPGSAGPHAPAALGRSYNGNLTAHMPVTSLKAAGSVHPFPTSMVTSSQYRQLLSDYGPGNWEQPGAPKQVCRGAGHHRRVGERDQPTHAGSKELSGETKTRRHHPRQRTSSRVLGWKETESQMLAGLLAWKVSHLLSRSYSSSPLFRWHLLSKRLTVWLLLPVPLPWFIRLWIHSALIEKRFCSWLGFTLWIVRNYPGFLFLFSKHWLKWCT